MFCVAQARAWVIKKVKRKKKRDLVRECLLFVLLFVFCLVCLFGKKREKCLRVGKNKVGTKKKSKHTTTETNSVGSGPNLGEKILG